jgi:putative DNA methylase
MARIEETFPIAELNRVANEERKGGTSRPDFEPLMYLHKWWARRLGSVFRAVLLYSLVDEKTKVKDPNGPWRPITAEELANPWSLFARDVDCGGKILLDPFMGSGITAIKGLACNCRIVAQDLNPVAWFLVKVALEPLALQGVQAAFDALERAVAGQVLQYFRTICPTCFAAHVRSKVDAPAIERNICERLARGDPLTGIYQDYPIFADVMYLFWVKELECARCHAIVPLFKGYMFAHKRKGRSTEGYYIVCPACGEVFVVDDHHAPATCPGCQTTFSPRAGPVTRNGARFTCPNPKCGATGSIVDHVRQAGKPRERLYAVQSYCPRCNTKSFTRATTFDRALVARAEKDLETAMANGLGHSIPDTAIPAGYNTKQATNYGYRDWRDMFSARQQLVLGTMLQCILALQCPDPVRDFLLLTFSKALEYSNMLCEYHRVNNYVYNLFKTHAFHPPLTPCESNPWGAKFGFGTFRNLFAGNVEFKRFNARPYIKYVSDAGKVEKYYLASPVEGRLGNIFEEPRANVFLLNGDSTRLPVLDSTVDAVITDPPYFDNVMYSELAEFYYAWLRRALQERYPNFRDPHVPNATEVIVNKNQGKGEQEYLHGLTAVFIEASRALKSDGLFVFTFHHQDDSAWGAMVQSVIDAGLYITRAYPILAEMSTAVPILNKANPQCDVILVCRKRATAPVDVQWGEIERKVRATLQESIQTFTNGGYNLSVEDLLVIAAGRGLEQYSRHYPRVFRDGERVTIPQFLSAIRQIVVAQVPQKKKQENKE